MRGMVLPRDDDHLHFVLTTVLVPSTRPPKRGEVPPPRADRGFSEESAAAPAAAAADLPGDPGGASPPRGEGLGESR